MVSPDLLALFTDSRHIIKKMRLKRGMRHYCLCQDYATALEALEFHAHDDDFDVGACLIYLFQQDAHDDPLGKKLAIELSKHLTKRDQTGLCEHFGQSNNEFWISLLGTPDDNAGQERFQQLFASSMRSQSSMSGLRIIL